MEVSALAYFLQAAMLALEVKTWYTRLNIMLVVSTSGLYRHGRKAQAEHGNEANNINYNDTNFTNK